MVNNSTMKVDDWGFILKGSDATFDRLFGHFSTPQKGFWSIRVCERLENIFLSVDGVKCNSMILDYVIDFSEKLRCKDWKTFLKKNIW